MKWYHEMNFLKSLLYCYHLQTIVYVMYIWVWRQLFYTRKLTLSVVFFFLSRYKYSGSSLLLLAKEPLVYESHTHCSVWVTYVLKLVWYIHITTYACITMLFSLIYHLRQPGRQTDRQTAIKYFYIITRYMVCVPSTNYFLYYKNKEYVSPVPKRPFPL